MELRNLSSVFLALLLLAPGVASAQTCPPPYLYCGERQYAPFLTSGTVTWTSEAVWNVSTPSIYKTVWTTTGFAVDVSDDPGVPGYFVVTGGSFTFRAPEPSTTSLLLVGVAGLVVLGRRRRFGATLLPASQRSRHF